ncbi:MAG: histone deacetylase family protein [Pseudomonadota bacterium]
MQLFFDEAQLSHQPQQFMVAGRLVQPFEVPERAARLAQRLGDAGLQRGIVAQASRTALERVHTPAYLDFLETAYARFSTLANAGPELFPNVHPHISARADGAARPAPRTTHVMGQAGWYMGDLACALGPGTWEAVRASASTALAGADALMASADTPRAGAREAFALCRPPGHHAYADRASGFCFLNNAAIAAAHLRTAFERVAIIDFDTHHGDGTQAIFYADARVFYGSVHTDPTAYYPFFAGYADERGHGDAHGTTRNLPLPEGAGDDAFIEANQALIADVKAFSADAVILSAGWDAHVQDPLSKLTVSTAGFERLGALYGALALPTLIVQEGGYALDAIETIAPAFINAYQHTRA